jgi:hypothetical protein
MAAVAPQGVLRTPSDTHFFQNMRQRDQHGAAVVAYTYLGNAAADSASFPGSFSCLLDVCCSEESTATAEAWMPAGRTQMLQDIHASTEAAPSYAVHRNCVHLLLSISAAGVMNPQKSSAQSANPQA